MITSLTLTIEEVGYYPHHWKHLIGINRHWKMLGK